MTVHRFIKTIFTVHKSPCDHATQRRRGLQLRSPKSSPLSCLGLSFSAVPISCLSESSGGDTTAAKESTARGSAAASFSLSRAVDCEKTVVIPAHAFARCLAIADLLGRRKRERTGE